jgi:hypothetical protein
MNTGVLVIAFGFGGQFVSNSGRSVVDTLKFAHARLGFYGRKWQVDMLLLLLGRSRALFVILMFAFFILENTIINIRCCG